MHVMTGLLAGRSVATATAISGALVGVVLTLVADRVRNADAVLITSGGPSRLTTPLRPRKLRARLLVALALAGVFAGVVWRIGITPSLPAWLFLVTVGTMLAIIDVDNRPLPDGLVVQAWVIGLLMLLPAGAGGLDTHAPVRALVGCVVFAGLFFGVNALEKTVSRSDSVKFAALLGLFLGWLSWSALIVGGVAALVLSGLTVFLGFGAVRGGRRVVPLGPALLAGTLFALFATPVLPDLYAALVTITPG